ncbi:MAG: TrmH family RNA methyltransferase [Helicobacteraceae bacterium]
MIVYGKQPFVFLLEQAPQKIKKVFLAKEIDKRLFSKISRLGVEIIRLDFKKAQSLAKGKNHQGFFAEIDDILPLEAREAKSFSSLVVLCGVSDAGNVGAIARSAYAMGVEALAVTGQAAFNMESAIRTSSAAAINLPIIFEKNPLELVNILKTQGFFLAGATKNGQENIAPNGKIALFLGSEDQGLGDKILKKMDGSVGIRMKNNFDSLNVSAAAAILIDRIFNGLLR